MGKLNNNQIKDVLIEAYKQSTGAKEVAELDLSSFVDNGTDQTLVGSKEQFTKSLVNVITKNWFTDSSYRSVYNDPFFKDESEYGAIMQMVSVEAPDVRESSAWQDFTSGVSTVGEYTVFLPIVHSQYYGKTNSWELPITITYEQWDSAFSSEEAISNFVNYVLMVVDNKIMQHMEDLNNANRNNFIAEKVNYAKNNVGTGCHVVDLRALYNSLHDTPIATRKEFMQSREALNWASAQIKLYTKYMRKQSKLFNTKGLVRFTPDDRLVIQILSQFESAIDSVAQADTYHNDVVSLPKYESVPYWQGLGKDNPTFEDVSKIIVKDATGTSTTIEGVVGFIADEWAIMHTIKKHRVASKDFDPEALMMYFYQCRDCYINNLTLNGLVLTVSEADA